ncbi:MAG: hypothetical protein EBR30_21760 [Cytophagia bacterium]|nr:hypothetical protein [Cytophagia bacterium]NBW37592.1 hypothetical protein [Cytophagia bacterium]
MESTEIYHAWDKPLIYGAYTSLAIAILILLYHELRLLLLKDLKEKYDYVNLHEIQYFWYAVVALIIAFALYTSTIVGNVFALEGITGSFVRVLYTLGSAALAYVSLSSLVRILYPRVVERRLQKIRNKPRISPAGNVMRKLSEEEEDVHLDQDQIDQESSEIHSVDYDVWIDEKSGFKKIEKYMSYQHAEECSECGFFTSKIINEEIEVKPTVNETGLLLKHYRCTYCRHREAKEVIIAKLSTNVK